MTKVFNLLGGRKYFLAILFYVLATIAFYAGLFADEGYVQALEWVLAIYLGANAIKAIPDALHRTPGAENENGKNALFDFFGGRKMFLAILFILSISVAMFIPKNETTTFLAAPVWVDGMKWCLIIYLAANTVKAIPEVISRKNGKKKEK
jgi:hypothetical protein